jgi:hypothetical protein
VLVPLDDPVLCAVVVGLAVGSNGLRTRNSDASALDCASWGV